MSLGLNFFFCSSTSLQPFVGAGGLDTRPLEPRPRHISICDSSSVVCFQSGMNPLIYLLRRSLEHLLVLAPFFTAGFLRRGLWKDFAVDSTGHSVKNENFLRITSRLSGSFPVRSAAYGRGTTNPSRRSPRHPGCLCPSPARLHTTVVLCAWFAGRSRPLSRG